MTGAIILDTHLCAELAAFLRRAFGFKAAAQVAVYADTSSRTTERWVRGKTPPNALQLLRLARHSGFRAELRAYLDRIEKEEADIAIKLGAMAAQPRSRRVGAVGVCACHAGSDAGMCRGVHGDAGSFVQHCSADCGRVGAVVAEEGGLDRTVTP